MANYTFEIVKYKMVSYNEETYKDFIDMMPELTVEATNYIAATLKAEKVYLPDKYTHRLIDTDAEKWPTKFSIF